MASRLSQLLGADSWQGVGAISGLIVAFLTFLISYITTKEPFLLIGVGVTGIILASILIWLLAASLNVRKERVAPWLISLVLALVAIWALSQSSTVELEVRTSNLKDLLLGSKEVTVTAFKFSSPNKMAVEGRYSGS